MFWGKAQPARNATHPWHGLQQHSLDVAAAAQALLCGHDGLRRTARELVGLDEAEAVVLVAYLCSLHDIGKFAKRFQAKEPELFKRHFQEDPAPWEVSYDHASGGMRLYCADPSICAFPAGGSPRRWRHMMAAVTGHHGSPPVMGRSGESLAVLQIEVFGAEGVAAARSFARKLRELLRLPDSLSFPAGNQGRLFSFLLAGIAVLSDWIGSNQEWFPYSDPHEPLSVHWKRTCRRAVEAVRKAGILPAAPAARLRYAGGLLDEQAIPTPMQAVAQEVSLSDGPQLFLVEDETGAGKTEAALMLAWRLIRAGCADGLYIALPTMATSNAMFDRLADAYRQMFKEEFTPSVALAHGAREMHEKFRQIMLRAGHWRAGASDEESGQTASAACAAWISEDRRRTFLADVGVGTIDQAVLGVLPSRHQSLRLLGLSRRVLIVDEVHAYDAYVQGELQALLAFQAALGGSAILLSATLPQRNKDALIRAFSNGAGAPDKPLEANRAYPLLTSCSAGEEVRQVQMQGRAGHGRALPVEFLPNADAAVTVAVQAARDGHAVLYIRNTVDDAMEAHAALSARGVNAELFHARFALGDRLAREREVLRTYGKSIQPEQRAGRVLVATQVVEQSLDLDFDTLISDLAPVDLLIQRAGRLWRHRREHRDGWPNPTLQVVSPEPTDDPDTHWYRRAFPRAAYVYSAHARLWLTARVLKERGVIESPQGLRSLVESVYGEEAAEGVPPALQQSFYDDEGRRGADAGLANINTLSLHKGYMRDGGAWDSDLRTPTRLMDQPQVTLRLARLENGAIRPYYADPQDWRAWRLSEVNVSERGISGEWTNSEEAAAVVQLKAEWRVYDADKIVVVLFGERGAYQGHASNEKGQVTIRYDSQQGLLWGD